MSDINITYEVLFEKMRNEKNNTELQKLPENFYDLVVEYVKGKQDLLKKDDELFSVNEKKQVLMMLENLEKILKDLYQRREKKIIELAIIKSKVRSSLVDTSTMQDNEVLFYEKILTILDSFRNNILNNVLNARVIDIDFARDKTKQQSSIITVRFLQDMGKFVDEDLKEYGPFEKETIATLPLSLAQNLAEDNLLEILDDMR